MSDTVNSYKAASRAGLRYEYREWLNVNGLPKTSAENLLLEESLSNEQQSYLKSFIALWVATDDPSELNIYR